MQKEIKLKGEDMRIVNSRMSFHQILFLARYKPDPFKKLVDLVEHSLQSLEIHKIKSIQTEHTPLFTTRGCADTIAVIIILAWIQRDINS